MGEKAIVEWNNRSLADLYRAKLKILFRLRSFTARRIGFDEGRLNRSTNIDSIRSMDARAYIRRQMSDYWEYIRWNACPRNGTFHSSNGDNIVPNPNDSDAPLFSLSSSASTNAIWNTTDRKLCWPSPFCRRYSSKTSIKWSVVVTSWYSNIALFRLINSEYKYSLLF